MRPCSSSQFVLCFNIFKIYINNYVVSKTITHHLNGSLIQFGVFYLFLNQRINLSKICFILSFFNFKGVMTSFNVNLRCVPYLVFGWMLYFFDSSSSFRVFSLITIPLSHPTHVIIHHVIVILSSIVEGEQFAWIIDHKITFKSIVGPFEVGFIFWVPSSFGQISHPFVGY